MDDTEQHPVRSTHHPSVSCAPPEARPSDAERAAVSDALQAHCADGRLKVEELEERLAAALTASTVGELERLVKDLPGGRPVPVPDPRNTPGKVKAGPPGLRGLRQCHELHTDRARAFRDAVQDILPVMVATGYDVIGRVDNELLVFERRDERVVVAFNESGDGGTRLVVHGTARRPVRKAFANLAVD